MKRKRILLDEDWRFCLGHASDVSRDFGGFGQPMKYAGGVQEGAVSPESDDSD